jgi:hypothetical protein
MSIWTGDSAESHIGNDCFVYEIFVFLHRCEIRRCDRSHKRREFADGKTKGQLERQFGVSVKKARK